MFWAHEAEMGLESMLLMLFRWGQAEEDIGGGLKSMLYDCGG